VDSSLAAYGVRRREIGRSAFGGDGRFQVAEGALASISIFGVLYSS
jgi:hypothetical protein